MIHTCYHRNDTLTIANAIAREAAPSSLDITSAVSDDDAVSARVFLLFDEGDRHCEYKSGSRGCFTLRN